MITKNKRCSESLEGCKMDGWITLHRKFQDWEWYTAPNHSFLFIHLLMKANHKSGKWRGHNYKRGDVLTSLSKLAEETHLSKQNIRTILKNFASTGEVNTLPNTKLTHLSICKYDTYQSKGKEANTPTNTELTRSQHSPNTELTTNNNETTKQDNKEQRTINLEVFDDFRKKYKGTKNGNETEFDNFCKKHKDWKSILPTLSERIDYQIRTRSEASAQGSFVPQWKNLSTWINNRCWEEEITIEQNPSAQTEPQMWIK